jgi:hypothetical protein
MGLGRTLSGSVRGHICRVGDTVRARYGAAVVTEADPRPPERPFWREALAPYARPRVARSLLAVTSGISANTVCFERELLDHYRMVFEKEQ